jgi:hypothetical protein
MIRTTLAALGQKAAAALNGGTSAPSRGRHDAVRRAGRDMGGSTDGPVVRGDQDRAGSMWSPAAWHRPTAASMRLHPIGPSEPRLSADMASAEPASVRSPVTFEDTAADWSKGVREGIPLRTILSRPRFGWLYRWRPQDHR